MPLLHSVEDKHKLSENLCQLNFLLKLSCFLSFPISQAYLEEKKLFHGDIAARNVLLHHNFTAKLCGLGLAYESHTCGASSVTRKVPVKWQAPERLLGKPPTIKADMWSFGILLYEMITLGAPPYPEVPPSDIFSYLQKQNIMKQPSSCQQAM